MGEEVAQADPVRAWGALDAVPRAPRGRRPWVAAGEHAGTGLVDEPLAVVVYVLIAALIVLPVMLRRATGRTDLTPTTHDEEMVSR